MLTRKKKFLLVCLSLFLALCVKVYWPRQEVDTYNFDSHLHRSPGNETLGHSAVGWPSGYSTLEPGDAFPEKTVHDLDGDTVNISELWRDRPLVLETGSNSCPIYEHSNALMSEAYAHYDQDHQVANIAVLYVREAHPGTFRPAHKTLEQKLSRANAMRDDGVQRRILVDTLDGELDRALGGMPNAVFIVGTDGIVSHVSMWNQPDKTRESLEALLEAGGRGADVSLKYSSMDRRPSYLSGTELFTMFMSISLVSGPDAMLDFLSEMPLGPPEKTSSAARANPGTPNALK